MAAAMAAIALPAIPVAAQTPNQAYRHDVRDAQKDRRNAIAHADSRRDVRKANKDYRADLRDSRKDRRNHVRDWRDYRRYDYNRLPAGQRAYYADQYYRDGSSYRTRRLTRNDRIYRGRDNRYYCRRSDGTTGLIIGGISGGVLGNSIAGGGSRTLGTLLGGTIGALLGQSIDRGKVICR
ncbi:MAG: hypothetical protein B7Y47_12310 [Sphingomonas sp. 28-63-12]|nr:MAG: hypothetical protein B7Y47_12310 [Sphingomonas sp. 28-63-12]